MGAVLQPAPLFPQLPVRRTERILKISPLAISIETADAVIAELHKVSDHRVQQEVEQRVRFAYRSNPQQAQQLDPNATGEDDFVAQNIQNPTIRNATNIPAFERYIFLSSSSNVLFDGPEFDIADLPKDLEIITAHADGINGRFIDIHLQTKFKDFHELRNTQLNQIIIQGEDQNWVSGVYERLRSLVEPEQLKTRTLIYGNALKLFWFAVVLLLFAEYRFTKWLYPGFSLKAPLSGTGALVMFGVLAGSILVFGNVIIDVFTYWFPYFEIEKNLSRARIGARKHVAGIGATIFSCAILNVLALVFNPVVNRLFGR